MKSLPLVTVITPTYNRADYIVETIESVLSQSYPNLEYIVLDDGSKDNSKEILAKYNSRIIWESHLNMGEVRTVNKGFEMAHGEIIGVVNSDDPLLSGAIASIVSFMVENPQVGVIYSDWNMIDADGKVIDHITTFDYSYINMLRWHHCMPGPGTFFRKKIVEGLQGRDPQFRYVSDFDFWLRAGLITEFARLPQTLAAFRVHPSSASVGETNQNMAEEHVALINKIFSLPNLPPNVLKIKNEAYSSAYYIAGFVSQSCSYEIRSQYFWTAIRYAPLKYLGEYRTGRLMGVMLRFLFPSLYQIWLAIKEPARVIKFIKAK
jgi:glycosyltransferase involved in cell wall biosynthesis